MILDRQGRRHPHPLRPGSHQQSWAGFAAPLLLGFLPSSHLQGSPLRIAMVAVDENRTAVNEGYNYVV